MTKAEETALRDEVAELRKQLSAIAVAIAELAAKTPYSYPVYIPYQPYVPPVNPWPQQPWITYGTETNCLGLGV